MYSVITFGKYKGLSTVELINRDIDYACWLIGRNPTTEYGIQLVNELIQLLSNQPVKLSGNLTNRIRSIVRNPYISNSLINNLNLSLSFDNKGISSTILKLYPISPIYLGRLLDLVAKSICHQHIYKGINYSPPEILIKSLETDLYRKYRNHESELLYKYVSNLTSSECQDIFDYITSFIDFSDDMLINTSINKKYGAVYDLISADILVDFKVSKYSCNNPYNILQLLGYSVLLDDRKINICKNYNFYLGEVLTMDISKVRKKDLVKFRDILDSDEINIDLL